MLKMFKEVTAVYIYIFLKKSAVLLMPYFLKILLSNCQYSEKGYLLFSNLLKSFAREFEKSYMPSSPFFIQSHVKTAASSSSEF